MYYLNSRNSLLAVMIVRFKGEIKKNILNISAILPKQLEMIRAWLSRTGRKCELEKQRKQIMNMLVENPDLQHAYITETDGEKVILTVEIHNHFHLKC